MLLEVVSGISDGTLATGGGFGALVVTLAAVGRGLAAKFDRMAIAIEADVAQRQATHERLKAVADRIDESANAMESARESMDKARVAFQVRHNISSDTVLRGKEARA